MVKLLYIIGWGCFVSLIAIGEGTPRVSLHLIEGEHHAGDVVELQAAMCSAKYA
jgi:hypothetical protein